MSWIDHLRKVVDESKTHFGRAFDVLVFFSIALSVLIVVLESVPSVSAVHGQLLRRFEWVITIWFTVEYLMRLVTARNPVKYATGFYGIIDLLAILPTYLSLFFVGTQALMVFRAFRMFLREMLRLYEQITRVAGTSVTVFITGSPAAPAACTGSGRAARGSGRAGSYVDWLSYQF